MRDYMKIYRFMAVMLLVIQAQSNFLYGMLRNKSAVIPGSSVLPLTVIPQKLEKTLRQAEEDLDAVDNKGRTALHLAVISNDLETVKSLLERFVKNVDATDRYGKTPLHYAGEKGNLDVVQLLLDNGADVHARSTGAPTALHWAAGKGNLDVVQMLLNNGADVHARSTGGPTALHWAAGKGNLDVVQMLLNNGANINLADGIGGQTSLHLAAAKGNVNLVKMLIENGANIDATDHFGMTPLHLAAEKGEIYVVQLLIKAGAYINVINNAQQTPYDRVLLRLADEYIAVQGSRLVGIGDEKERIAARQEIAHNQAEATERERLQVCAYMLQHPDQINSILLTHPTKSARKR